MFAKKWGFLVIRNPRDFGKLHDTKRPTILGVIFHWKFSKPKLLPMYLPFPTFFFVFFQNYENEKLVQQNPIGSVIGPTIIGTLGMMDGVWIGNTSFGLYQIHSHCQLRWLIVW
jgi:hypothetical protein